MSMCRIFSCVVGRGCLLWPVHFLGKTLLLLIYPLLPCWILKTKLRADYGSDHELLIAKFRLKLKKVRKTTGPFGYDLNQIPYDYTVEVTNRFKGLALIECLENYGWRFMTLHRRQWSRPSARKMQKSKMAVWRGLTNNCEKKRSEKQRRKGKT